MDTTNEITPEDSFVRVYLVPMTEEEIEASEYNRKLLESEEKRIAEQESAKQSAIQKLSKLGLTVEELNAIIA
jgi:hypothetical protein